MSRPSRYRHQLSNCLLFLIVSTSHSEPGQSFVITSKATNAQEFITEFANAFSGSGDSIKLDEFFADDAVYSDYMTPATVGLDKKGWLNHCTNYYANVYNMRIKTFNVFGDIDDLVGWEHRFTFTSKKDNPEMGVKEGEDITIRGMSIIKFRRSEKGLQIVEQRDYYSFLHKED